MARDGLWLSFAELPKAWPQQERSGDGSECTLQVDDRGSREVEEALLEEPAATPGPVGDDRVDDPGEDDTEDDVRDELRAVEHRAEHDGERHGTEHRLEEEDCLNRDVVCREGVAEVEEAKRVGVARRIRVVQEPARGSHKVIPITKTEREPDRPEHEECNCKIDDDLSSDRTGVLHT